MSRELDAEVAEEVMGYSWRTKILKNGDQAYFLTNDPPREGETTLLAGRTASAKRSASAASYGTIPEYSASLAAAWSVVDHLSMMRLPDAYKPAVRVTWYEHDEIALCEIAPIKFDWENAVTGGECETVPEAICRAALAFVRSRKR